MAGLSNKKDKDAAAAKRRELEAQHGISEPPAQPSPAPVQPPPAPVAAEPPPAAPPEPAQAEPAQPAPPSATPPPVPPAPVPVDQATVPRSLHEAEKTRWANAHTTIRTNANQLLSQKDQMIANLQAENQALRTQQPVQVVQQPTATGGPMPPPSPAGNGNGSGWTPEEQQLLARMREEHGEAFMNELFQLQDARMQRQLMANFQALDQRFNQLDNQLGLVQENQLRGETSLFEQQIADAGHPDWEQIRLSPDFQNWMMAHPMGQIYWGLMLPQETGMGADSQQMSMILGEYKTQNPANLAATGRDLEAEARANAAALANRGQPIAGAEPMPAAPADYLMVSDLGDLTRRHSNDPAKVRELRKQMEASLQAGRLVDDMSGRAPVVSQGAVVP